ncbi:BCNT-domain-containing protein [Meredithblackwellia eburnea MCA 4105]
MAPAGKTLAEADLIPSDDEDEDFVAGSDSESEDDSSDERPTKRAKVEDDKPAEPAMTKEDIDDLWASFNEPIASVKPSANSTSKAPPPPKVIKITVQYEFAGEKITQEKEVLETSEEAKRWLAKQGKKNEVSSAAGEKPNGQPGSSTENKTSGIPSADALFGPEDITPSTGSAPSSSSTPQNPITTTSDSLKPKLAPKRAKAGGLAGMAAALAKPAKLNTLEKSKLDWNRFVDKEELAEDLSNARKDGYLEKQDFLRRTDSKREEDWEKSKSRRKLVAQPSLQLPN